MAYHVGIGILDTIYAGTVRKLKNGSEVWLKKDDVTKEFIGVVIEWLERNNNEIEITINGKPSYKIKLEKTEGEK